MRASAKVGAGQGTRPERGRQRGSNDSSGAALGSVGYRSAEVSRDGERVALYCVDKSYLTD